MKKFAISILLLTFVLSSNFTCGQCPPIRGRFSSTYITDLSALYPRVMWLMPSQHVNLLDNGKGKAVFLCLQCQKIHKMSNKFPAPSEVLSGRVPRYELIASDVFPELLARVNALSNVPELLAELLDRVKFSQSQVVVSLPRAAEVIGIHAQTLRNKIAAGLYPSISVEGSPRRFMTQEQIFDVLKLRAQRSPSVTNKTCSNG